MLRSLFLSITRGIRAGCHSDRPVSPESMGPEAMNGEPIQGSFKAITKTYRSKSGFHYFVFDFVASDGHIDIFCRRHPSFNGQDSDPARTHLFGSGRLCFVSGKEPQTQRRAEQLAAQWAEYFCEYRQTGKTQR